MMNKYSKGFTLFAHIILIIASISCVYPFLLLIMASFTEETTLIKNGYSIFPEKFSMEAYEYIFAQAGTIFRAYGITLLVTAVGTVIGLFITSMLILWPKIIFREVRYFLLLLYFPCCLMEDWFPLTYGIRDHSI